MKLGTLAKALAAVALAGTLTATTIGKAEAHGGRWVGAFVAGAAAATVLGAYAYSRPYYGYNGCYRGPVECRWVGGGCWVNRWGEQVCRRGREQCARRTICD